MGELRLRLDRTVVRKLQNMVERDENPVGEIVRRGLMLYELYSTLGGDEQLAIHDRTTGRTDLVAVDWKATEL